MVGMNTMYTAVSGRVREIGVLQVLGFGKGAILRALLIESLALTLEMAIPCDPSSLFCPDTGEIKGGILRGDHPPGPGRGI